MRTSVVSGYSLQPLGNPTLPLANPEWCQQYGTENQRSSLVSNVSSIFQRLLSRTHFLSSTPHPRWRCSMLRSMQRVTWLPRERWFICSVYCIYLYQVVSSLYIIIYRLLSLWKSYIRMYIIYITYILVVVSSKLGFLFFRSLFFERCCLGSSEWVMEMLGPSPRSARWRQRMYRWITPNGGEK